MVVKMKEGKKLCLNVNDKLKEMERILKLERMKTMKMKKEKIKKKLKKLINERYGFKKS